MSNIKHISNLLMVTTSQNRRMHSEAGQALVHFQEAVAI